MRISLISLFLSLIISILSPNTSSAQTHDLYSNWALNGGSPAGDDRMMMVTVGPNREVVGGGFFLTTVDFDPGPATVQYTSAGGRDAYVCKYSAAGALQWAVNFSGSQDVLTRSVAVGPSGEIYVVGEFYGTADFNPQAGVFNLSSNGAQDVFMVKLDANGNFIWANSFGGSGIDRGLSIKVSPFGQILITGSLVGRVDVDPNPNITQNKNGANGENPFMSSFDSNGNLLWNNTYIASSGSNYLGRAYQIEFKANGNAVLTGCFYGTVDFDGSAATYNLSSNGNEDCFLTEVNSSGQLMWATSWGGSSEDIPTGLDISSNSEIHVGGFFRGTVDFDPGSGVSNSSSAGSRDMFISKFNPGGIFLWNRTAGNNSSEVITKVVVNSKGDVFSTGYFYSNIDLDPDPNNSVILAHNNQADGFIWQLDNTGSYVSSYGISGSGHDISNHIEIDSYDNLYVSGGFSDSLDLNPANGVQMAYSNGGSDFFLMSLGTCSSDTASLNAFGCQFYVSPSGKLFNQSGQYQDTISTVLGCDSILTINLQLNKVGTQVIQRGDSLEVQGLQNASYQWLDCNNNFAPIQGQSSKVFKPTVSGDYAVQVSDGNCRDTSLCQSFIITGLSEQESQNQLRIFPNPNQGQFTIQAKEGREARVFDLSGKLLNSFSINLRETVEMNAEAGIYFIKVELSNGESITKKIVIK